MRGILFKLICLLLLCYEAQLSAQVIIMFPNDEKNSGLQLKGVDCNYEFKDQDSISESVILEPIEGEAFLKLNYNDTLFLPECEIRMGSKFDPQYLNGFVHSHWTILNTDDLKIKPLIINLNLYHKGSLIVSDRITIPLENQSDSNLIWKRNSTIGKMVELNPEAEMIDSVEIVYNFSRFDNKKPFVFYIDDVQLELFRIAKVDAVFKVELRIYPNPTKNLLQLQGDQPIHSVRCYDAQGRLQKEFPVPTSETQHSLDVSNLTPGIYLLGIELKDGSRAWGRFVKE
jgi:hypothetical protein